MASINPIELQKALKGVDYPASKEDILAAAERNDADDAIRSALEGLKETTFERPTDVTEGIDFGGDSGR